MSCLFPRRWNDGSGSGICLAEWIVISWYQRQCSFGCGRYHMTSVRILSLGTGILDIASFKLPKDFAHAERIQRQLKGASSGLNEKDRFLLISGAVWGLGEIEEGRKIEPPSEYMAERPFSDGRLLVLKSAKLKPIPRAPKQRGKGELNELRFEVRKRKHDVREMEILSRALEKLVRRISAITGMEFEEP